MNTESQKRESPEWDAQGSKKRSTKTTDDESIAEPGSHGNGAGSEEPDPLAPHHRAMLDASSISPKVITARGYRTATKKAELKELGFSDDQCRVPALVIPVYDVGGEVALHQIRPDEPRAGKNGKALKYETPKAAKMALDIPPVVRPLLGNPNRPLFITEGVRKADSAVSHGLCCVALLGVWSWRGANEEGGKTVLAAWERIALEDREAFIVFDSDVALKPEVHKALVRLKGFLDSRKAKVRVIYLEPTLDGSKVGLDDFFAAGGILPKLLALATDTLRKGPGPDHDFPYRETSLGLLHLVRTQDGVIEVPLCNFTARIVTECEEDDGVETRRTFEIAVTQGERTATVRIPWEKFNAVNWAIEAMGADAAIVPGPMARDHIRFATQLFSKGAPREKLYTHLGWRKIDEQWVYLHAGGAIGAEGAVPGIAVATPPALERFLLPDPPAGEALTAAIRASLGMRTVAPLTLTVPLLAAVYRAVLGDADSSAHLTGRTGLGKTELVALAQQHYGAGLDARHLPASWTSTGNSLELLAFAAKDALLVIDDFAPTGSVSDVQRFHREADRVFRAQGNRSGRMRATQDAKIKSAKPPRGMVLSTGEDTPRGQSLRSRILILEPSPEDVKWARITECQRDAGEGLYAQSLAGFLRWLAPQYETIKKNLRREVETLRAQAVQGSHKRTPEIAANLAIGFHYFLTFAQDAEAISMNERDALWADCRIALSTAADSQSKHLEGNEPARRFLELIGSAISSGKAHLASPTGGSPMEMEFWGWRLEYSTWNAKGTRIGWLDGDDIYLQPDASYGCAQDLARSQGDSISVSVQTLRRRLKEKSYLASWDEATQTTTVRRTLEGKQQAVLHVRKSIFAEGIYPATKPSKPSIDPEPSDNGPEAGENAGFSETQQGAEPSKPSIDPARESQAKSTTNGANAGFAGFPSPLEDFHQETKTRDLFEGKTDAGFAGFAENQNPASGIENPAFAPEASEAGGEEVF